MKCATRILTARDQLAPVQAASNPTNVAVGRINVPCQPVGETTRGAWPTTIQLVGILAFGQSVLFLLLWLLLCASVGAAPEVKDWSSPPFKESTYEPSQSRDPFLPAGGAVAPNGHSTVVASAAALRLQGIVYDGRRPSAMVNNEILFLGKPTILSTSEGAAEVKAVEITRESVVLEVGGKRIELRLGLPAREPVANP